MLDNFVAGKLSANPLQIMNDAFEATMTSSQRLSI